jgi:hypothetical protein
MKTLMNKLLESLREKVTENLATIRQNEKEIRMILTEPLSNQRTHNLSNRYALSKRILLENTENLKIQNMIVAFLRDFKEFSDHTELLTSINNFEKSLNNQEETKNSKSIVKNTSNTIQMPNLKGSKDVENNEGQNEGKTEKEGLPINKISESLFELTFSGKLAFNKSHPQFNDDEFYNKLLAHHTSQEEYEICAELVKTRRK